MTLKEMLTQSPEQQQAAAFVRRVDQAKFQAQNDLSATRYALSQAEEELSAKYLEEPFSLQSILTAKQKIADLKKGLADGEAEVKELFGE